MKIFFNLWKLKKKNLTPLHYSVENNTIEILELLLLKGAYIDPIDKKISTTILLIIIKTFENK